MKQFNKLGDVPVLYDRLHSDHYGKQGVQHDFRAVDTFINKLDAAFFELWSIVGKADTILSAGAYVDKPGWHGRGLAFDLDAIHWPGTVFICHPYHSNIKFYLGVESIIRKYMGTVLNFFYNKLHIDHIHMQSDGRGEFNKSYSQTLYVQAALVHIHGEPLLIDGKWGPITTEAFQRVLDSMDMDQGFDWKRFLTETGKRGLYG